MNKIEVKYNGVVIGHTQDEGKTIEFLDTEDARSVKKILTESNPVGISSRRLGEFDENGFVSEIETKSLDIMDVNQKIFEEDEIFKILKRFTLECVHGGDFDQGNTEQETLSVLKSWWNKNRHRYIK